MSNQYWHTLSPGLIETFRKFALQVRDHNNKVHIRRDVTLTITENNNFQKLRYWGLVAKYKEMGNHIAGYWVLTKRGGEFLRGEITLPKKVKTEDNHKIEESKERVLIYDYFKSYTMEYWQETFHKIPVYDESQGSLL